MHYKILVNLKVTNKFNSTEKILPNILDLKLDLSIMIYSINYFEGGRYEKKNL